MAEPMGGLRGRAPVLELIRDCLALPPEADRPLTMLLGPSGIGASETHATAKRMFAPGAPCAYFNFDAGDGLGIRAVLGALARELGRSKTDYKEPSFPRLIVGLLATGTALDALHRAHDRRRVSQLIRTELQARERQYGSFLGPLAEVVSVALGAPPGVSETAAAVLGSVTSRHRQLSRRQLSHGVAWYGDGRIPPCEDPADALVELNSWQHGPEGAGKGPADVDRFLLRAFLADLREHARGWLNHRSFLLLLDNGHTELGRRFLELLLEARQEDRAARRGCDPLVVVASVHQWLPEWGPANGVHWNLRPAWSDLASLEHWKAHRVGDGGPDFWWYPLELRPLLLSDTRAECAAAPQRADVASAVQRLTGGLPWAVRHTLAALRDASSSAATTAEDDPYLLLRQVPGLPFTLPRPGPAPAPPTLALASLGYLLDELADEPGSDRRAVLVRWSAARDLSVCGQVFGADGGSERLFAGLRERWLLTVTEGGRAVLHPWLRRLLLWELAADETQWRNAHERLCDYFAQERDGPGGPDSGRRDESRLEELYHQLALGRTADVAAALTQRFAERGTAAWIRDFNLVTSAPNRLDKTMPPLWLLDSLIPGDGGGVLTRGGVIQRLVIARWIWSDPLSDPGRRLNPVLAGDFDHLAALRSNGVVPLYDESARYQQWRDQ